MFLFPELIIFFLSDICLWHCKFSGSTAASHPALPYSEWQLGIQSMPAPHQYPRSGETDSISLGQPSDEPECEMHTSLLFVPPREKT